MVDAIVMGQLTALFQKRYPNIPEAKGDCTGFRMTALINV
jgi:hypothetical protein